MTRHTRILHHEGRFAQSHQTYADQWEALTQERAEYTGRPVLTLRNEVVLTFSALTVWFGILAVWAVVS